MKKRFLSILTALALCLTFLPATALALPSTTDTRVLWQVDGQIYCRAVSDVSGQPNVSEAGTDAEKLTDFTLTGTETYMLAKDIKLGSTLIIKGTITLDLNGYALQYTGEDACVIQVGEGTNNGTLTLQDSNPSRTHKFHDATPWTLSTTDEGTVFYGGVITGGKNSGVRVEKGSTFTMEAGSIVGCESSNSGKGNGGGVYVGAGSTFTMKKGSSIMGCNAKYGGGVYVTGGTFTMEGEGDHYAKIADCKWSGSSGYGGGVAVYAGGTFTMNGGAVTQCTMNGYGGGVYVGGGSTFTMSGGSSVNNNKATKGGGVFLQDDASSGTTVGSVFKMQSGSIVGNTISGINNGGVYVSPNSVLIAGGESSMAAVSIKDTFATDGTTHRDNIYLAKDNSGAVGTIIMSIGGITPESEFPKTVNVGGDQRRFIGGLDLTTLAAGGGLDSDGYTFAKSEDGKTYTLTLKNAYVGVKYERKDTVPGDTSVVYSGYTIRMPSGGDVTVNIELEGDVRINSTDRAEGRVDSISYTGGTGPLHTNISKRTGASSADLTVTGMISIGDNNLTLKNITASIYGITNGAGYGSLTIDNANITVSNGVSWSYNYAEYPQNGIVLSNGGKLTATGSSIFAGKITINDTSVLTLSGGSITKDEDGDLSNLPGLCVVENGETYSIGGDPEWPNSTGRFLLVTKNKGTAESPELSKEIATHVTLRNQIYTVTWESGLDGVTVNTTGATISGLAGTTIKKPTNDPACGGYTFNGWLDEDGHLVTGDAFGVITKATTFTGSWTKNESTPTPPTSTTRYTITASAGQGGSISPAGAVRVAKGNDKTFVITADTGYTVSQVLVDGKDVGAVTTYTFENVRAAHTIQAVFTRSKVPAGLNSTDHVAYVHGYEDGTVRPEGKITRAETAVMLYSLLTDARREEISTTQHSFNDIAPDAWYRQAAATMAKGGYLTGRPDGGFDGDCPITRAEFITALVGFIGVEDAACTFTDVSRDHWAYAYIATATSAGWISGFEDGSFRPDQSITRAEAMTVINQALDRGVNKDSTLLNFKVWPDNPAGAWYYYEVIEATNGHDYTGRRPNEDWTALH